MTDDRLKFIVAEISRDAEDVPPIVFQAYCYELAAEVGRLRTGRSLTQIAEDEAHGERPGK